MTLSQNSPAPSSKLLLTAHSRIRYHPSLGELAETVAEIFEFAYGSVGQDFGFPAQMTTLYMYETSDEMYEGLIANSPFSSAMSRIIAYKVGISPASRGSLHLLCSRRTKVVPFLWHALIHEHSHGVLEDIYGSKVVSNARWLYEGLGEYEGHRSLLNRFPDFERRWSKKRFKVTFNALVRGKLISFKELTTQDNWIRNIERSPYLWNLQYAEAYAFVLYLVKKHGISRIKEVLSLVKDDFLLEKALEEGLQTPYWRLEVGFFLFVIEYALLHIYLLYALSSPATIFRKLKRIYRAQ